jgi:hypothetical protein
MEALEGCKKVGLVFYSNGATIKTLPQINILAASPNVPGCMLDVIICPNHMAVGDMKDSNYISNSMLPLMTAIGPNK